ncbi:Prolycopene isomerase, chloroplastic [Vitis vinifera]|uniref:Prolycopene isomerase, chloroplastic n=1 Tax=Vitis vinifera TaxID=29760 RepID=A0A438CK91_VITVI|nr:Prolycopene isomerase, chloroplastic [Vitis vinifera]
MAMKAETEVCGDGNTLAYLSQWQVGTPKTHRRYLARDNGTYGPMPRRTPKGLLGMPFNTTAIHGLYCVGDSCFPGQGVIAVAFSGVMCAHRVAADIGKLGFRDCFIVKIAWPLT